MMEITLESIAMLMDRGGPVMWLLLALSLLSATLIIERVWFFTAFARASRRRDRRELARLIRRRRWEDARGRAAGMLDPAGQLALDLLDDIEQRHAPVGPGASGATDPRDAGTPPSPARIADAVENQRHRLERFLPTLSTVITAAPMLGILGTVLGIIQSFELLSDSANAAMADPSAVGGGIAQALLTTAFGLVIALFTLFPYNLFRVRVDRDTAELEAIGSAFEDAAATSTPAEAAP